MMSFKEQVSEAHKEISTKAYVEYSAMAKLIKMYGLKNVLKAIKKLPLKHKNPIGYIIKTCSGKGIGNQINTRIFNKI